MKRTLFGFWISLFLQTTAFSQTAIPLNTEKLGALNPRGSGHSYANVWGYAANGREYALLGADDGTSIIEVTDPANPVEVAHIPGPNSSWRELRTYQHYAYVVTEGSTPANLAGVHIIDLSELPEKATLVNRYVGRLNHGTVHTVSIDGKYLYLNGSRNSSLRDINVILDLTDPVHPVEVGAWEQNYWHDSQAKNDTIFASAIYGDGIQIIDARDKSNLKLISQTNYPSNFTHNIWMTDDNNYIVQTDETPDMPLNFWTVSNPSAPVKLTEYRAGQHAMAHNVHISGNLAHVAYYEDGYRVFDLSNRKAPVLAGYFDVDGQLPRAGQFTSVWGVYPYLPSGNILLSDIERGLVIIRFTGATPGYFSGQVRDQNGNPVPGVKITRLINQPVEDYMTCWTEANGSYSFGGLQGILRLKLEKEGYDPLITDTLLIVPGKTTELDLTLRKRYISETTLKLFRKGVPVSSPVFLTVSNREKKFSDYTTADGKLTLTLPEGFYEVTGPTGTGYIRGTLSVFTDDAQEYIFEEIPGFYDNFSEPMGWILSDPSDKSAFKWVHQFVPDFRPAGFLPENDRTGDFSNKAMLSRARRSSSTPGVSGSASLTSPGFFLGNLSAPEIRFQRVYRPPVQLGAVNDTFRVLISYDGNQSWLKVFELTEPDTGWVLTKLKLPPVAIPATSVKIRFVNIEGVDAMTGSNSRPSSYSIIDDFELTESSASSSVGSETAMAANRIEVYPAYPNPFNPETTLSWTQSFTGEVILEVSNLLGQLVWVQKLGTRAQGHQVLNFRPDRFSSGVYFYTLKSDRVVSKSGKLILLK